MAKLKLKVGADIPRALRQARPVIERRLNKSLDNASYLLRGHMAQEAPKRTGFMAGSIYFTKRRVFSRVFQTRAHYDLYVHDGTSRQRANPFMTRAVEKVRARFANEIQKGIDEVSRHLGGR